MMRAFDFSSWNAILTSLLGLILMTLVAVGMRLIIMQTIQRKQQRENRQINERLRTLIAAYKTLGGSFTGELAVDPQHLRQMHQQHSASIDDDAMRRTLSETQYEEIAERRRRIRDNVEAALSDIILLGTEEQVRLAAHAASEMVAGRKVHVAELVVSLRDFIRQALDLQAIEPDVAIPHQGPLRPANQNARGGRGGQNGTGNANKGGGGGGGSGNGNGAMGIGMMGGGGLSLDTRPDPSFEHK